MWSIPAKVRDSSLTSNFSLDQFDLKLWNNKGRLYCSNYYYIVIKQLWWVFPQLCRRAWYGTGKLIKLRYTRYSKLKLNALILHIQAGLACSLF